MTNHDVELELAGDSSWQNQTAGDSQAQLPASEAVVDQLLGETDSEGSADPLQRRARPRRRPSSPRLLIYRLMNGLVDRVQGSPLGMTCLVAILVGSLTVIWYSMTQRGGLISQGHEVVAERGRVGLHLEELRNKVSQRDLGVVMASVSQAESQVFADYQQLAQWLSDRHDYAENLSLNFRYTLGDAAPSQVKNMLEVPISIQVAVARESADIGYLRVLEFLKNVVDSRWHVEIISAAMVGEAAGVNEMRAKLKVWVHETAELEHEEDSK